MPREKIYATLRAVLAFIIQDVCLSDVNQINSTALIDDHNNSATILICKITKHSLNRSDEKIPVDHRFLKYFTNNHGTLKVT